MSLLGSGYFHTMLAPLFSSTKAQEALTTNSLLVVSILPRLPCNVLICSVVSRSSCAPQHWYNRGVKADTWPSMYTGTVTNSNCFSRAQACCTASLCSHSSNAVLRGQVCPELGAGTWCESSFLTKSFNCHSGLLRKTLSKPVVWSQF